MLPTLHREIRQRLVGDFISQARQKAGKTQLEVGTAFYRLRGCDEKPRPRFAQYVSNWEQGLCYPKPDELALLADVLDVQLADLAEVYFRTKRREIEAEQALVNRLMRLMG